MRDKTVLIIGGGIAGLAAGCYAQMNGYRSQIFELHHQPGGLCTAWQRGGYTFDGCIHYLFGSGPGRPFNQMWHELGAVQGREFVNHHQLLQVQDAEGQTLMAYADPDALEAHLVAISPRDADLARAMAEGVRQFTRFDMWALYAQPRNLMNSRDWQAFGAAMLPFVQPMTQWALVSAREFANRFHHPFLRQAVAHLFGWEDIPMMAGLQLLAYLHNQNAGYPVGASLAFAQAIADQYVALGGEIHYRAPVERIMVQNDRAVGVRLYDDREISGDYVISTADGRHTLFTLLEGRYITRQQRRLYSGKMPLHNQLQVSLGVAADLQTQPHWVTHLLAPQVRVGARLRDELTFKHYAFDPTLAAAGKSSVVVTVPSEYGYWQRIYGRRLYDTEQLQVADQVLGILDQVQPGLLAQVEVRDVATPVSYERFTGNWQGATCGWLLTKETMPMMIQGLPKTQPGLENFYQCGQWVEPGGSVPIAAASGRQAIQLLCHTEGQPFRTTEAAVMG